MAFGTEFESVKINFDVSNETDGSKLDVSMRGAGLKDLSVTVFERKSVSINMLILTGHISIFENPAITFFGVIANGNEIFIILGIP